MSAIDLNRRYDLSHLVGDLRLAARTIRSQTFEERCAVRDHLAESLHERLEPHAVEDELGLDALEVWTDSLGRADASDVDLLQEFCTASTRSSASTSGARPGCRWSRRSRAAPPTSRPRGACKGGRSGRASARAGR